MKTVLRKILAAVAAFIVLDSIALMVGSLERLYGTLFPGLSLLVLILDPFLNYATKDG